VGRVARAGLDGGPGERLETYLVSGRARPQALTQELAPCRHASQWQPKRGQVETHEVFDGALRVRHGETPICRYVVNVPTTERHAGPRQEERRGGELPMRVFDVRVERAVLDEADRILSRDLVIRIRVLRPGWMVELHQRH